MSSSSDSPRGRSGSSDEPDFIEFEEMPVSPGSGVKRDKGPPREGASEGASWPGRASGGKRASRFAGVFGFILFLPCMAGLLWMLLPGIFRIEAGIRYPYQLDAEEGFVHLQAMDLLEGRSIYTPIDEEPYLVGNYPPVYPALVAIALKAGASGLPAGRIVVALASALIGIFLLGIARVCTSRWSVALLAPLLFFVSYEFYTWSPYSRVDLPALALTLAGALTFLRWFTHPAGRVASALLFVAAAYTRQTAILAPVACALALLLTDRRRLGWFLVPYLGVGLGVFLILNFLLGGEFWNHLVVYNRNTMDWGAFRSVLKNEIWFFYRWWIIALAAGGILIGMGAIPPFRMASNDIVDERRRQGHRAAGIFATLYFVISAFSLAAFAKSGSAANYALEPLAAAAILVVTLIGGLQDGSAVSKPMGYRWISAAGLLVVSLCLTIHVARILPIMWTEVLPPGEAGEKVGRFLDERRVDWALFSSANPTPEEVARGDRVVAEIRETPGEVLSELPVFAMAAGCEVVFQPFIMTTLAREGRWQEAPFLEGLRRGRFGLIVTTQDLREVRRGGVLARYTDSMAEAILGRYALVEVSPPGPLGLPYFLWRPRPESAE